MVTKEFFSRSLSTRPQSRTIVGLRIHTSAPSYDDGPAWPCTGALYPCIRCQPPGMHQRLSAATESRVARSSLFPLSALGAGLTIGVVWNSLNLFMTHLMQAGVVAFWSSCVRARYGGLTP